MFDATAFLNALLAIAAVGFVSWLVSVAKRDVSIVDTLWSLMFLLAAVVYAASVEPGGARATLILVLVSIWALRLAGYITWRNWGEGEDRRYQAIRNNNEPRFWLKSLYIVFGLQGFLAWVISLPLLAAIAQPDSLGLLDVVGVGLWLVGMVFEAGGDWQLARFKARPQNKGKVMDTGLWRYTRHPNYFGNACLWWGIWLAALDAPSTAWTAIGPAVMTFMLLRVSGVTLLESSLRKSRPGYEDYVRRTSAFFPWPPRKPGS